MLGHSCKMNSGQPKYYLFFKREPIARPNTNYLIHIVSMIKNWDIIVVGKGLTWVCQLHVHSNLHVGQQREIYYFIYIYIYIEREGQQATADEILYYILHPPPISTWKYLKH